MARHVGTDAFACGLVSCYGYASRGRLRPFVKGRLDGEGYNERLWRYLPEAQRVLTVFLAYQVKNMYDTFYWSDGPLFVLHHLLAGAAAWGGMYPGVGHVYSLFFMGLSEVSTCVLVVLANFDDEMGAPGLALAYPNARAATAGAFVVAFLACRIVAWPVFAVRLLKDMRIAVDNADDKNAKERRPWIYGIGGVLAALTVLQFAWLGEIVVTAKREIDKMRA